MVLFVKSRNINKGAFMAKLTEKEKAVRAKQAKEVALAKRNEKIVALYSKKTKAGTRVHTLAEVGAKFGIAVATVHRVVKKA